MRSNMGNRRFEEIELRGVAGCQFGFDAES